MYILAVDTAVDYDST